MAKRPLYCESCAQTTEHMVEETGEDDGSLALCMRCGRIHPLTREETKPRADATRPADSRTR